MSLKSPSKPTPSGGKSTNFPPPTPVNKHQPLFSHMQLSPLTERGKNKHHLYLSSLYIWSTYILRTCDVSLIAMYNNNYQIVVEETSDTSSPLTGAEDKKKEPEAVCTPLSVSTDNTDMQPPSGTFECELYTAPLLLSFIQCPFTYESAAPFVLTLHCSMRVSTFG